MSHWQLAELERVVANLVRIGVVTELDQANARVKVSVSGLTTDWLPWTTSRAGATRTWSAPRAGEQVLVMAPHGDLAQAVVIPSIYQDAHAAPATSQDQEHVVFPDGSTVDYNSATNTLTVTVSGSGNVVINCKHATVNADNDATVNTQTATVNASTKVQLTTPLVDCSQNVTVHGLLTVAGGMAISGGSGTTAAITGNVTVNGNVSNTGTLQNNGVNVGSTHVHSGVQTGGGNTAVPH